METNKRVTCDVLDGVAHVRLDRPEKFNALDNEMFAALVAAGRELMVRDDVGAVLLTGSGRAFCAGLDLEQFQTMRGPRAFGVAVAPDRLGAALGLAQQAVHVWSQVPAPVIAGVHGVALGGGLQLALGADIRIASPDTRLSVMEVLWGLVPDMLGTQLLPELVGRDVAKDLALTGRTVTGTEAHAIGLVTRLADDPLSAANELAQEIAHHGRNATRGIKKLLELAGRVDLESGLDAELAEQTARIGSAEQTAVAERRLAERRLVERGRDA